MTAPWAASSIDCHLQKGRPLLGHFVSGDDKDAPQITTPKDWHVGFAPVPKTISQPHRRAGRIIA
jgi:hypothetical protein